MKGKRGWIRILEATVAVLIVSATMLAVYSGQDRGSEQITVSDYSYSLQKQILADIVLDSDLRLDALVVENDAPGDAAYDSLKAFVDSKIPDSFGYLLRVCDLGNVSDFCKMDSNTFIATLDKDVFVEEVVISSELGVGSNAVYSPRKVRLFFWEGGFPPGYCVDECSGSGVVLGCSTDLLEVLSRTCADHDGDGCLEYDVGVVVDNCVSGELCAGAACVVSSYSEWTCGRKVNDSDVRCIVGGSCSPESGVDGACNLCINLRGFDGWVFIGDSGHPANAIFYSQNGYYCSNNLAYCWDWGDVVVDACELTPSCSDGREFISAGTCIPSGVGVLSANYTIGARVGDRYYYDVTLTETNGVSVTIDSGERCFSFTSNCYSHTPSFVVPASGSITRVNQYFETPNTPNTVTYTYYGTDSESASFQITTMEY